jgi:uncharacterized Fe-S cluster-containing protein
MSDELQQVLYDTLNESLHEPKGDPNYVQLERAAKSYKRLKELGMVFDKEEEEVILGYLTDNQYEKNFLEEDK